MSTYWYMTLDVALRTTDEEARAAIGKSLAHLSHRLNVRVWNPAILAERLPMRTGRDDTALPEAGWTVDGGRLLGSLFMENMNREIGPQIVDGVEVDTGTCRHEALFAALRDVCDARIGDILGTLASENSECAGALLLTEAGVRYAPSTAMHPGRGLDFSTGPDFDPISRVPPTAISLVDDDGFACEVDASIVVADLEARLIDSAIDVPTKSLA